ncbi:hypothetical protein V2I01_36280 [Micromonospora sp. BRA006-A]|nr:hypothetical protein [Micromonospora sp. BRA006-A]
MAGAGGTFSAAALYREILESWLDFEERRTQGIPGAPVSLRRPELWQAVSRLAFQLWESGEAYLRLAELAESTGQLAGRADSRLSGPQAAHAVGAGSLLVPHRRRAVRVHPHLGDGVAGRRGGGRADQQGRGAGRAGGAVAVRARGGVPRRPRRPGSLHRLDRAGAR